MNNQRVKRQIAPIAAAAQTNQRNWEPVARNDNLKISFWFMPLFIVAKNISLHHSIVWKFEFEHMFGDVLKCWLPFFFSFKLTSVDVIWLRIFFSCVIKEKSSLFKYYRNKGQTKNSWHIFFRPSLSTGLIQCNNFSSTVLKMFKKLILKWNSTLSDIVHSMQFWLYPAAFLYSL